MGRLQAMRGSINYWNKRLAIRAPRRHPGRRRLLIRRLSRAGALASLLCIGAPRVQTALGQHAALPASRGRWRYLIHRREVVERSDIILQRPNVLPASAMPLGNGRLGVAVWAQDGFTAQLNRGDTFPLRRSPGQVVLPGLKKLASPAGYAGRLDLYDGEFRQRGGGMTATAYVAAGLDVMFIDVTGANPKQEQIAELHLWAPRRPQVLHTEKMGILAETWRDHRQAGASGQRFGSLAAITADARQVRVEPEGSRSVRLRFLPHADGSFRVLIGAPAWRGGDAAAAAAKLLAAARLLPAGEHRAWWHRFWSRVGLMKLHSRDGAAGYFEHLRAIDLFTAAAESRGRFPGSQAGIGDLFSAFRDHHQWDPAAFWHWNLRMQVDANLGAGAFALNQPYFRLYRENLGHILAWTRAHMGGRPGACIPETMRFNGRGYENETWAAAPAIDCGEDFRPFYNARTLTTGAEVSLWIWRQFEYTGHLVFLRKNYPVMRESARFLRAYATRGRDGRLHTFPSNAHETEWDVHDPTTDIGAMRALFPAVMQAAALLGTDGALVKELKQDLPRIPGFPMVALASPQALVDPHSRRNDTIIIASHDPGARIHNSENVGLEPVWPYELIDGGGARHALGVRTFLHRPYQNLDDWSFDPIQAARLGLAGQFESSLRALTAKYQAYPSGFARFAGPEFYVEQIGVVADALQQALVQDSDGLIRIAPAWPKNWDADATVYVLHGGRVHVWIRQGRLRAAIIENGTARKLCIRNPWPGRPAEIFDARTRSLVLRPTSESVLQISARPGRAYLLQPRALAPSRLPGQPVSGRPATAPESLGKRSIGLPRRP